jgi:hypothetical protein
MNPIVLVNRVTIGAPRSVELRLRVWNDGRFPLPFTVTIPVSFELREGGARAPERQPVRDANSAHRCSSTATLLRKWLICAARRHNVV